MMVFMPLVLVWIGQFCRDVIGRQNVKVVVIGRMLGHREGNVAFETAAIRVICWASAQSYLPD